MRQVESPQRPILTYRFFGLYNLIILVPIFFQLLPSIRGREGPVLRFGITSAFQEGQTAVVVGAADALGRGVVEEAHVPAESSATTNKRSEAGGATWIEIWIFLQEAEYDPSGAPHGSSGECRKVVGEILAVFPNGKLARRAAGRDGVDNDTMDE